MSFTGGRPPTPPFGDPFGPGRGGPSGAGAAGPRRPLGPPPGRRFLISVAIGLLVGVVELLVFTAVGRWIGPLATILLVIATSFLGVWLLRREGAKSWRSFRESLAQGRPPGPSATEGLLVLIGGMLMVLPGFVSDLVGALLVAPPTRRLVAGWAQSSLARRLTPSAATSLFGPRTVRIRTGPPRQSPPSEPRTEAGPDTPSEPIEGEIIDPR